MARIEGMCGANGKVTRRRARGAQPVLAQIAWFRDDEAEHEASRLVLVLEGDGTWKLIAHPAADHSRLIVAGTIVNGHITVDGNE